jgi:hypothetical protein
VAYSPTSGTAYAWNHRTQRGAQTAALALCEGPEARLWACGAEITIAVARGPRGAFGCEWADPSMPTAAWRVLLRSVGLRIRWVISGASGCGLRWRSTLAEE